MYLIREDKISLENKYYKPNGYYNTLSSDNALQLPNCTLYALLRAWESLGQKVKGIARSTYGFPDAKEWLKTTQKPIIDYPKAGSIAVFGGSGNHVLFIEDVLPSGGCLITQSSYTTNKNDRGTSFWNKKVMVLTKGATISGYGTLLGFIDVGVYDIRKTYGNLYVKDRMHRVRTGAGLNFEEVQAGCYCPQGYYEVSEIIENDGYKWAKLEDDCYIAIMDGVVYTETKNNKNDKIKQAIELLQGVLENE